MHRAAARSVDDLWAAIAEAIEIIQTAVFRIAASGSADAMSIPAATTMRSSVARRKFMPISKKVCLSFQPSNLLGRAPTVVLKSLANRSRLQVGFLR